MPLYVFMMLPDLWAAFYFRSLYDYRNIYTTEDTAAVQKS